MKKFYLIYFVCGLSIIALIYYFNYGSYNMTIDRMKKDLTSHYSEKRYVEKKHRKNRQYGSWATTDFGLELDDEDLDLRVTLTLCDKGSFSELNEVFYHGQLVATCQLKGKWDIKYVTKDYIFTLDYDDYIDIKNVGFNDYLFKLIDAEIRASMVDVYCRYVIVDCTPKVFSIRDIENDETTRYVPAAS